VFGVLGEEQAVIRSIDQEQNSFEQIFLEILARGSDSA